jgi:glutamate synthase domain-containing protein 1/glutamate synthase domain-containing protein 3
MEREQFIEALIASRCSLEAAISNPRLQAEAEGGCGVIGMVASVPVAGRHLLQALQQMRNRGNGKGGGAAAVGLDPDFFGVQPAILSNDYLLSIAYLDGSARAQIESNFIEPTYIIDQVFQIPALTDIRSIPGLEIQPPDIWCYFVRVRPDVQAIFRQQHGITGEYSIAVEDEIVYQNTYRLNRKYYAATGDKQAFVLSHGKNLLVLKMVGYGDDVFRYYGLENLYANVWIGHHRYPTKGKVWHPGGAHPFIGMHEALVHNGDFANYTAICSYLSQRNMHPLFLTDTEVAALEFDLLHRIYGYPLEYVIEAMAPTTERDFTLLPPEKRRLYQLLQTVHIHSSPDGPWFFLIAQSDVRKHVYRLIGITDTSMLRPQVFAMQQGTESIGFAASEKQAIDAALASLAQEDSRFWARADLYWNARGGSHTDGGAFIFNVHHNENSKATLVCTDKFGRVIVPDTVKHPPNMMSQVDAGARRKGGASATTLLIKAEGRVNAQPKSSASVPTLLNTTPAPMQSGAISALDLFCQICEQLPTWNYDDVHDFLIDLVRTVKNDEDRDRAFRIMNLLMDRHYPAGSMKRSFLLDLVNESFAQMVDKVRDDPSRRYVWAGFGSPIPECIDARVTLVLDARDYPPEGNESLARAIVTLNQHGFRRIIIANTRGQRFIGSGLGPLSDGIQIDIYGSPGDYLASGIDGAKVIVHGSAQDQLAQIMKGGKLVVYGDVGQTFMYAAKGGEVFVLGNAAGRPLINAVGRPRVVINGTCLDYLAESFMAGDPLNGGGFVIVNGVRFDEDGTIRELDTPYPGGNLFSLASGGAIYMRDPRHKVGSDQLNGGEFAPLTARDWTLLRPYLEKNESIFGIPLDRLLTVNGTRQPPELIYRKILPAGHEALMPEEAWVRREA